jgi:hypothetical protein
MLSSLTGAKLYVFYLPVSVCHPRQEEEKHKRREEKLRKKKKKKKKKKGGIHGH